MADKKRVSAKPKKTTAKKNPKIGEVETSIKVKETEADSTDTNLESDLESPIEAEVTELNGDQRHEEPRTQKMNDEIQEGENSRVPSKRSNGELPDLEKETARGSSRPSAGVRPQDVRRSDEYTIETFFDRNQRLFVATVVEYPELKCTGHTRDEAQVDLEERLEDHVYDLEARGGQVADALQSRHFPEKLDLPLSQSLYRKLDQLSRYEKLPIDRLVGELLASAVEKRLQTRPSQTQQHPRQQNNRNEYHNNREHHQGGGGHHGQGRHQGGGHHSQGRHQGNNRPQRGASNYRALDTKENFMEYVRNLEKSGGPGWKKR